MKVLQWLYGILFSLTIIACSSEEKKEIKVIPDIEDKQIEVRIINNEFKFFDRSINKPFTPMGYNYAHVQDINYDGITFQNHSTFSTEHYLANNAEMMLSKLQTAGFNTVRVFLSPASLSNSKGILNVTYIKNVVDFIVRAERHNIYIILTTDLIPLGFYQKQISSEQDITWLNSQYIFQEDIDLEVKFWQSLITEFKSQSAPLNTILSYELRNEFFFNSALPPFDNMLSTIQHPNGNNYDLSDENQTFQLINDSFLYWSSTVRNSILEVDENALISVGFFAPNLLGKPSQTAIVDSELDFVDLHLYSSVGTLEEYENYFELSNNKDKLIIMGEFGQVDKDQLTVTDIKNNLVKWKDEAITNHHIDGWLLWTWDTKVGIALSVSDDDDVIFDALSPNK